jgi:hypothetical protein
MCHGSGRHEIGAYPHLPPYDAAYYKRETKLLMQKYDEGQPLHPRIEEVSSSDEMQGGEDERSVGGSTKDADDDNTLTTQKYHLVDLVLSVFLSVMLYILLTLV